MDLHSLNRDMLLKLLLLERKLYEERLEEEKLKTEKALNTLQTYKKFSEYMGGSIKKCSEKKCSALIVHKGTHKMKQDCEYIIVCACHQYICNKHHDSHQCDKIESIFSRTYKIIN